MCVKINQNCLSAEIQSELDFLRSDYQNGDEALINSAYLRHVRLARHYTLNQLSKETGCTASFLSQIERGLKEPSLATLRKISECLDVSLVSFFIQPETDPPGGDSPAAEEGYHIVRRGEGVRLNLPELSARC